MIDRGVDQFLLVRRLAFGELEKPGHGDIEGIARQQYHRLVFQRGIRCFRGELVAQRALVAVPAVGGGKAGDGRVAVRECRVLGEILGLDAVAYAVQAGQHHLEPGVAAFRMGNNQQLGTAGDIDFELAEQAFA